MLFAKSIQSKVRQILFLSIILSGLLMIIIHSASILIQTHFKLQSILKEEREELLLFGLLDSPIKPNKAILNELTEMYMIHHISSRAYKLNRSDKAIFSIGIYKTKTIPKQSSPLQKSKFSSIIIDRTQYLKYSYPYTINEEIYLLELIIEDPTLFQQLAPSLSVYFFAMLIILLFSFPLSFSLSKTITKPLNQLKNQIIRISQKSNRTITIQDHRYKELNELEIELEKLKNNYFQTDKVLNNYSSLVSHEIRNRLTTLHSTIDQNIHDKTISSNCFYQIKSISDILDSVKAIYLIQSQQYVAEYSLLNLNFALQDINSSLGEKKLNITLPENTIIDTDTFLFKVILKNIIENMVRHSNKNLNITYKNNTLIFTNQANTNQFSYMSDLINNLKKTKTIPNQSLGLFIIYCFSEALNLNYDLTFNKNSLKLKQTLTVPLS